jgi:uncharacterized integral membrane protein (TIGR00698 family)
MVLRIQAAAALGLGVLVGLLFGNPFLKQTRRLTPVLISAAVVGLGAGMNLHVIADVGRHGLGLTVVGIALCLALGWFLTLYLGIPHKTGLLISVGTAICGGSAIAAMTTAVGANDEETSVALGTVFLLNGAALFLFPAIGHYAHLDQETFGWWAALSIHDTSSVVGAALVYGSRALAVATTVKLARAMWILPLTAAVALARSRSSSGHRRIVPPWFLAGFLAAASLSTWVPAFQPIGRHLSASAQVLMAAILFLVGTNLTRAAIGAVGMKPFACGAVLWATMASLTFAALFWRIVI